MLALSKGLDSHATHQGGKDGFLTLWPLRQQRLAGQNFTPVQYYFFLDKSFLPQQNVLTPFSAPKPLSYSQAS
jgi:hypothetical protein